MEDLTQKLGNMFFAKNKINEEEECCSERILKLADKLDKMKIPFKAVALFGCVDQLKFDWCDSDIICHIGSYGHEKGLFEVMGEAIMTTEELAKDSVAGYITMRDAIKRIKQAYKKYKEQAWT